MEEFWEVICFRFILGLAIPKVYSTNHQFREMLFKNKKRKKEKREIYGQVSLGTAVYSISLLEIYSEH